MVNGESRVGIVERDSHTDCSGAIFSQHAEEGRIFQIESKAKATGDSVMTKKLHQRQAMSRIGC